MAKKARGVKIREDGTLEKRFTLEGKRYSVYAKSMKELEQKEQELRNRIAAGQYTRNQNVTLDRYFDEWIVEKEKTIKPNSSRLYRNLYRNHISPELGKEKIRNIERRQIIKIQNELRSSSTPATTNLVIDIIKMILKDAVSNDIISKNPGSNIRSIQNNTVTSETSHRALTIEEQSQFIQEAKSEYYYELIAFLLSTGMRFGEAAALTWKDVDFRNNTIHITKTLTFNQDNSPTVGTPKSKTGKRDIPMNEGIKAILRDQRKKIANVFAIDGSSLVFPSTHEGHISNQEINNAIRRTLRRLEKNEIYIEQFTAHALRDTFATRFIEQGGTPQTLKTLLGHSTLSMTMDLYAHVLPNTKQEEMNKIKIAL